MNNLIEANKVISDLKECLKIKETEIEILLKACESKTLPPKPLCKVAVEEMISQKLPMLTSNQIKLMTKHKKRVSWTADELAKGFTSVYHGHRSHNFWTKTMQIPLPAIRTLNTWASKITIAPGILKDVLVMLRSFVETMDEKDRQVLRVNSIFF